MASVLIVVQLIVSVALVIIILMQKSDGGALGIGGGSSSGGLFSPRGAGDVLTRTTAILAVAFFACSLALTMLALKGKPQGSIIDTSPASNLGLPLKGVPSPKPANNPALPQVPSSPSPKIPNR